MKAEKIDKILPRALEGLGLEKRFKESRLINAWKDLVGEQIALHTQPMGIKKKKLYVKVDNSTWVYQLTLHHKAEILDKLRQQTEEPLIKDIFFKVGRLEKGKE